MTVTNSPTSRPRFSRTRWALLATFMLGACVNQATHALDPTSAQAGLPVRFGNEKLVVFGLGANDLAIHVADEVPRGAMGLSVLVDDAGPVAERLAAAGIAFERHDKPFHANLPGLQLKDTNGNLVQILVRP